MKNKDKANLIKMSNENIHQLLKNTLTSKEDRKILEKELLFRDANLRKQENKKSFNDNKWTWGILLFVFILLGKITLYLAKQFN